ncbi:MAG: hypothetical protein J6N72_06620 [Psychrobacter sp.]|nr:hypothetical protein [Psychrobacter sp.]
MNQIKAKDNSGWFIVKGVLYLALMLIAFLLIAMGIVPFLVRLDTMGTTSRIGHGSVALASMFFLRFIWRRYRNLLKNAKIEEEEYKKAIHEAALAEQKRYQKLTHNEKSRENESDKQSKTLAIDKTLKSIRYMFTGLGVFFGIIATYSVMSLEGEAFPIGVIIFGSTYLFYIVCATWAYRWYKKTNLRSK